jgi:hypothetical protein
MMMRKFDFIIVGNSVASIVSAIELSRKFKIAIINPSNKWGAYFAGFVFKDERYDAGMNLLEFTSYREPDSNILTYDPTIRYDFTRFLSQIEEYITSKIHCVEVDLVKVFANKVYANDIIMANSLEIFDKLSEDVILQIKRELLVIIDNKDKSLHASQKHIDKDLFLNNSFFSVSIANHGMTFHELFIEPLCKKIFNISSKDFPALFHRLIWLPLYYPETLLDAIRGDINLVNAKFHYPSEGHFSSIVDVLSEKIATIENISILDENIIDIDYEKNFTISTNIGKLETAKLIWGSDLSSLLKSFNFDLNEINFDKASLTLAFCRIKNNSITKKFSVLYNLDNSSLLYRITNQESCAGITNSEYNRIVVEFNSDLLDEVGLIDNDSILNDINKFLISNEFIKDAISSENLIVKTIKNAVNLPSKLNIDKFNSINEYIFNNIKEIELVGSASSFYSASFNDQIIQGLKIGKKFI